MGGNQLVTESQSPQVGTGRPWPTSVVEPKKKKKKKFIKNTITFIWSTPTDQNKTFPLAVESTPASKIPPSGYQTILQFFTAETKALVIAADEGLRRNKPNFIFTDNASVLEALELSATRTSNNSAIYRIHTKSGGALGPIERDKQTRLCSKAGLPETAYVTAKRQFDEN